MKYKKSEPHQSPAAPVHWCNADARNSQVLAGLWDDFINAKKRMESEGPFLLQQLPKGPRSVFDAAMGTGVDSIFLVKSGYEVTGNELDPHYLAMAHANSRGQTGALRFTRYDWLKMDSDIKPMSFDAVICLGNSLTLLFEQGERLRALGNFYRILGPGGILILDTRNYDYILDERKAILKTGDFRYSGRYVYCGTNKVRMRLVEIDESEVLMDFTHRRTGANGRLYVYPFRRNELYCLLHQTGFKPISFFSDYAPGLNPEADFHQFVCVRPPDTKPFNPYLL